MTVQDMLRELLKIEDALGWAIKHHERQSEANAALHVNDKVMYTPLTARLHTARASVNLIRTGLKAVV